MTGSSSGVGSWVAVASTADLDEDDVIEVIVGGRPLAIYHTKAGYFASDGICTHEHSRLCEGFVFDNIIECGKHQGRFDLRTGAPKGAPVHVPLKTYPVRVVEDKIETLISDDPA
jgi:3-phenylpropionate/trans-cinnamate dioxygenase ferredoxin component